MEFFCNTNVIIWSIYSWANNVSYVVFIWRYEGTICVYTMLWIVFGGIYVVEHVREGGLYYFARFMGRFWGLFAIVLWNWLCNIWVWVVWGWFSNACCEAPRCWLWSFELIDGFLWGFFGCGCMLLMCIGFYVGVDNQVWGFILRCLGGWWGLFAHLCMILGIVGRGGCIWLWLWS